jgi:hypothetical protein
MNPFTNKLLYDYTTHTHPNSDHIGLTTLQETQHAAQ